MSARSCLYLKDTLPQKAQILSLLQTGKSKETNSLSRNIYWSTQPNYSVSTPVRWPQLRCYEKTYLQRTAGPGNFTVMKAGMHMKDFCL